MTVAVLRKANALEALAMFAVIMAYIWEFRFSHPLLWILAVALILISQFARDESAPALGFRFEHFGDCLRKFGPILLCLALAMLSAALWFGTMRPLGVEQALLAFGLYLPWGLFQQYLLNSYFLKRFDTALSPTGANIATALLFSAVHTPNWFLMLVTPVAGYAAIWVYRRYRNLYFLGLAHATIGTLLFLTVPDSWSHHLNIGPPHPEMTAINSSSSSAPLP